MSRRDLFTLINMGKEVEKTLESAFSLWSWLPSCKVCAIHHGDYYSEFTPSPSDIMEEACMYFSKLKYRPNEPLSSEEKEWFERCPCGEEHNIEEEKE